MNNQFDILLKGRKLILKVIDGYSIEQLNKTPEGFGNNIVWNIAHLVATHQILCYKFSGVSMHISDEFASEFKKGTAPQRVISAKEFEDIKKLFLELPIQHEKDYTDGIFKTYEAYTTSVNVALTDIETATTFNTFHEGIHLGSILAIRKLV